MPTQSPFADSDFYNSRNMREYRGVLMAAEFEEGAADGYRRANDDLAVIDRSDRGLVEVTGADRKAWLHNLVTNEVSTLDDHAGNYAFAVDVKGRVQFDLNILVRPDRLWLDIDAVAVPAAMSHLDRFRMSEDVAIKDVTNDCARLGCAGPRAAEAATSLGAGNFTALAALASVQLEGDVLLFRHDFAGRPGFELVVPRGDAATKWSYFVESQNATPIGLRELDVLRIEAGIPWLGRDIDETTLPAETGQIERGISYQKGCYLGQEIVERMRSRDVLPRKLVRLRTTDAEGVEPPTPLRQADAEVGRVTSLVAHPVEPFWVGLGYLSTRVKDLNGIVAGQPPCEMKIFV